MNTVLWFKVTSMAFVFALGAGMGIYDGEWFPVLLGTGAALAIAWNIV